MVAVGNNTGVQALLPLVSSLLCFVFAGLLCAQWWQRRRPYQLVWGIGLLCYAVAAAADAGGQIAGWSGPLYRAWYFFGAIASAAWLGLGAVFLMQTAAFGELVALGVFFGALPALFRGGALLGSHEDALAQAAIALGIAGLVIAGVLALVSWERPHRLGVVTLLILAAGTAYAAVQVLGAPVDATQMLDPATGIPHGNALPETVRLITPLFNIGGALALVWGATYSGWVYWRRGSHPRRLVSNGLIALGAFAPSLTSSLNRFGITGVFYWGELLGVLLIFAGFLASTEVIARRTRAAALSGGGYNRLS